MIVLSQVFLYKNIVFSIEMRTLGAILVLLQLICPIWVLKAVHSLNLRRPALSRTALFSGPIFTEVSLSKKLIEAQKSAETQAKSRNESVESVAVKPFVDEKIPVDNTTYNILPSPGRWQSIGGNYVLFPAENIDNNSAESKQPIGVIHFLGGAFVGAAPHLSYRYLLEELCAAGYIIVATPYRLDLDYVRSCDDILSKFDNVAIKLVSKYGYLPVIGLGHSCGALLQTLITSLFPDAPRAVNILISFNNRPVSSAIPAFEEVILPISQQIMSDNTQSKNFRETVATIRNTFDNVFDMYASSPLLPQILKDELIPAVKNALEIADQIPPLLKTFANGKTEFIPSPIDTKEVCRRMYRARRTLLIQFENDSLDESDEIEKVLKEANTIMRMKRPMVEMQVIMRKMTGTHLTPLTLPINLVLDQTSEVLPLVPTEVFTRARNTVSQQFLQTINDVKQEILEFLQESMR